MRSVPHPRRQPPADRGATMVEALTATALVGTLGIPLLGMVHQTLQSSVEVSQAATAGAVLQQVVDGLTGAPPACAYGAADLLSEERAPGDWPLAGIAITVVAHLPPGRSTWTAGTCTAGAPDPGTVQRIVVSVTDARGVLHRVVETVRTDVP